MLGNPVHDGKDLTIKSRVNNRLGTSLGISRLKVYLLMQRL